MDLRAIRPNTFASKVCGLPAADLWPLVADPTLLVAYSSELQAIRLCYQGPVELGSTFEGDQARGERRWTTTSTITALEKNRRFEWTVGDLDDPVSQWSFHLDEHRLGSTLTQRVILCGGGRTPLTDRIASDPDLAEELVDERLSELRERMRLSVAGIIDLAMNEARRRD